MPHLKKTLKNSLNMNINPNPLCSLGKKLGMEHKMSYASCDDPFGINVDLFEGKMEWAVYFDEKFIEVEEVKAGADKIRGDAETIQFMSSLRIKMQAKFKPKLKVAKEEKEHSKITRKELEDMVGRKLEDADVKILKRARREGDFGEKLLDVKVKGKHDKFA